MIKSLLAGLHTLTCVVSNVSSITVLLLLSHTIPTLHKQQTARLSTHIVRLRSCVLQLEISTLLIRTWKLSGVRLKHSVQYFIMRLQVARLSIITGLDYWNGLLEWTTGLTFFVLKIIFMAYNEISCQYMHYIGFWHECISAVSAIQPVQWLPAFVI